MLLVLLISGCDNRSYTSINPETKEITTVILNINDGVAYLPESKEPFTGKFVYICKKDGTGFNDKYSTSHAEATWNTENQIEKEGIKGAVFSLKSTDPVCIEENYINGKRNGLSISWNDNFKDTFNYNDGKLNGVSTLFCLKNIEEQICGEKNYKDGLKSGLSKGYSSEGELTYLRNEDNYKEGVQSGLYKSYDKEGNQTLLYINTGRVSKDVIIAATKNLTSEYDSIEEHTWYKSKFSTKKDATGISAYLGKFKSRDDYTIWFRFKLLYKSYDWLFIHSFIVVADDQRYEKDNLEFERDNNYSGIKEWYDNSAKDDDLIMIKAIVKSKNAIIRFKGSNTYEDYLITSQEKEALKDVLEAYEALVAATS